MLGEEEANEFYQPLQTRIEEVQNLVNGEKERLDKILEICKKQYGKTALEQLEKRKANTNAKKRRDRKGKATTGC